jgi:hypothetical protein
MSEFNKTPPLRAVNALRNDPALAAEFDRKYGSESTPVAPGEEAPTNFFDRFDTEADATEPGLYERYRLGQLDAFYRSTLAGAGRIKMLHGLATMPKEEFAKLYPTEPEDLGEVSRLRRQTLRFHSASDRRDQKSYQDEYEQISGDLARYDILKPWTDTGGIGDMGSAGTAALAGALTGGLLSPENLIGGAGAGLALLGRGGQRLLAAAPRTARALGFGLEQGAIQAATDPYVQLLSIKSEVQKEYEPIRTAVSFGAGVVVGGGLHFGGELVSSLWIRKTGADLAKDDPLFRSPRNVVDEPKTTLGDELGGPKPEDLPEVKPPVGERVPPSPEVPKELPEGVTVKALDDGTFQFTYKTDGGEGTIDFMAGNMEAATNKFKVFYEGLTKAETLPELPEGFIVHKAPSYAPHKFYIEKDGANFASGETEKEAIANFLKHHKGAEPEPPAALPEHYKVIEENGSFHVVYEPTGFKISEGRTPKLSPTIMPWLILLVLKGRHPRLFPRATSTKTGLSFRKARMSAMPMARQRRRQFRSSTRNIPTSPRLRPHLRARSPKATRLLKMRKVASTTLFPPRVMEWLWAQRPPRP